MFRTPASRFVAPLSLPAPDDRFEGFADVDLDTLRGELPFVSLDDARAAIVGGTATLATCAVALPDDELEEVWESLSPLALTPDAAVRCTLARLRERGLPKMRALLPDHPFRGAGLVDVRASWVAPWMARLLGVDVSVDRVARRWLAENTVLAAPTLVHAALTTNDPWAWSGLEWLVELNPECVRRASDAFGAEARAAIDVRFDVERGPGLGSRPLPKVYRAYPAPRRRGGAAIDDREKERLGRLLEGLPPTHPLVREAVDALEPADAVALGQTLLDTWVSGRMATQNNWIAGAYVALTGDVGGLGRRARKWDRGKDSHERRAARAIVELLRVVGSDDAIAELATFAATARDPKVRAHAEHALWRIATVRKVPLDDLTVPTLELDATLSYGARTFRARLSSRLDLELVAEDGKVLATLPAARKTDDADAVKDAKRAWRELRAALADALRAETRRLELAMIAARSFEVASLQARAARSPVAAAVQRRVLWLDQARGLTVRLAEDGTFADLDDAPTTVEGPLLVPHRLVLTETDVVRWSAIFADYELVQPFPQLMREVVHEAPIGRAYSPGHVVGLWNAGWQPEDGPGGVSQSMVQRVDKGLVRAMISPGVPRWDPKGGGDQTLESIELLGEVTEVERSEAFRALS